MHALLDPPAPDRAAALTRLHAWLRDRTRIWALARLLPGAETADGLAVALAWQATTRGLLRPGLDERALDRARDELHATLRDAEEGTPRSPLGAGLAWWLPRYDLAALALRKRVEALHRDAHVSAFASRAELRAHQARTAHEEARALAIVLGATSEREELLAQALANGIERAHALARTHAALRETGRLHLPAEALAEAGVRPSDLATEEVTAPVATLFTRASEEAERELLKGWPLCFELGHLRGRLLAGVLRWHAAELAAIRTAVRRGDVPRPRGGWLRLWACGLVATVTRRAP